MIKLNVNAINPVVENPWLPEPLPGIAPKEPEELILL